MDLRKKNLHLCGVVIWMGLLFGNYTTHLGQCISQEIQSASNEKSLPPSIAQFFQPPKDWAGQLGSYRSPLLKSDGTTVEDVNGWRARRTELRAWWDEQLGAWPPLIEKPKVTILETVKRENFRQTKIRYLWTPNEETTAYLLIPNEPGPKPAVLSVFYEPETGIGLGKPNRDFALQLARRGFVTLSIGTTKASEAKTYAIYYPNLENAQVAPLSMLGYAAANSWYVLANHPEVDADRIGIIGHSFGGKWAMFASCLFEKFACAAWSDPGIVFDESRPSVNYWEPWYLGYHSPPWRTRGLISPENPARGIYVRLRKAKHDLHLLHALMAPRPFLVSGGSEDPPSRWQALNHTIQINSLLGYEHRVGMTNRPDHSPDEESNRVVHEFFEHFLMN